MATNTSLQHDTICYSKHVLVDSDLNVFYLNMFCPDGCGDPFMGALECVQTSLINNQDSVFYRKTGDSSIIWSAKKRLDGQNRNGI